MNSWLETERELTAFERLQPTVDRLRPAARARVRAPPDRFGAATARPLHQATRLSAKQCGAQKAFYSIGNIVI